MTTRDKVVQILALDFAILVTIIGAWFVFVMAGPTAHFSNLYREDNLIKLTITVVAWLVLYAQHIRVAGDFNPPPPPTATVVTTTTRSGPPVPPPAP